MAQKPTVVPPPAVSETVFKVNTITCQACADSITKALKSTPGIDVQVNVPKKIVRVVGNVSAEQVKKTLEGIGHIAVETQECSCCAGGKCKCGDNCRCGSQCSCSSCSNCCEKSGGKPCAAKARGECTCGKNCTCGDSCKCSGCPGSESKLVTNLKKVAEMKAVVFGVGIFVGVLGSVVATRCCSGKECSFGSKQAPLR